MSVVEGRGPDRAPPDRPGRAAAALALVATLGMAVALTVVAVPGRRSEPRVPFDPGSLEGIRPDGARGVVRAPGAVLYVDDGCPWCAIELQRAAAAVAGGSQAPTVVVSPGSDGSGSHVPRPLRPSMLHDADGSIARRLGVRGVPFLAELDSAGVVSSVRVGVSAPADVPFPQPEVMHR